MTGDSMKAPFWGLLGAMCLMSTLGVEAEDLKIAAASDLNYAFKEIAVRFEKKSGHKLKLTFGSSGNFFAQIQHGAPFDLFFSADVDYPKKLEADGLIEPGTLYVYAVGRLVLWVPSNSSLNVHRLGMSALLDPSVQKVAIANPRHAPYGRAAVAAMNHFGVYDRVRDKLILGENISQAAHFVESGNADVGVLALSLAIAPAMGGKGKYWRVPEEAHPPILQGAAILKSSRQKPAAVAFLAYLKSAEGMALMQQFGFILPEGAKP